MASTPSNRLKLTPSNQQFFPVHSKPPNRGRTHEPRLFLKRVVGTTCNSPTGFDSAGGCFAYIAGGAVVVVDVEGAGYNQRFYRARPAAVPVFAVAPVPHASPSPNTIPKANDARNRVAKGSREPSYGSLDWGDSPTSKTWTSRERIKAATCVSLSSDGGFLAVGETGYAPRVLIFSLSDNSSSDTPLVSISEHTFGVRAVAWSQDGKYLASLGTVNDGFLFIWKVDPRNGAARLFQQNRCTSYVNGMVWLGSNLATFGTRHVKVWKIVDEEQRPSSSSKRNYSGDASPQNAQKTLPGRNVLLGSLLEASFTCALPFDDNHALLCSDGGDVCLLDDTSGQMKLTRILELRFPITCCTQRGPLAFVGGKAGQLATLDMEAIISCEGGVATSDASGPVGLTAMGYVQDQLVTIDSERSIDIWNADSMPEKSSEGSTRFRLPGQNDPVLGIQSLTKTGETGPAFFTWSGSGKVLLWDLNGSVQESLNISVDGCHTGNDMEPRNQLCVVRADGEGKIFAAGDRVGVLRVVDQESGKLLFQTKAHSSEITHVAVHYDSSKTLIATSGRDRTVQLFHRTTIGSFDLLQTLQFPARVTHLILSSDNKVIASSMDRNIQVHELTSKEGEPGSLAAVHCRSIALKASPTSMVLDSDCRSIFVSSLDRSIHHFEMDSGRQLGSFKCVDENGADTAVLDSLIYGPSQRDEPSFLLGVSNTDKSVRLYDSTTGSFTDREWGHTESINGVALIDDGEARRKVVSVGCDGTIMIWDLDLRDPPTSATSRSPSPAMDPSLSANRPPLRRVLSKAELAEYQRPSSSSNGSRRSPPPRALRNRKSRPNMSSSSARTPTAASYYHSSPYNSLAGETPSRRASSTRSGSPPPDSSPGSRLSRLSRRPSLPVLGSTPPTNQTARKKSSAVNLRSSYGFGSLQMASEQTCRQLRAYRKKLSSSEPITSEMLTELDAELRLTMAALGDRASRSKHALSESVLNQLLDQYSERLVSMLDEKLRLRLEGQGQGQGGGGGGSSSNGGGEDDLGLLRPPSTNWDQERPRTACEGTRSTGA